MPAQRRPRDRARAGTCRRPHSRSWRGARHCLLLYRNLYTLRRVIGRVRPLEFLGGALADLRAFPRASRREAGYQLDRVQQGLEPDDWKPMATIGYGVREIRIRDAGGAFRVIYVASFSEAVYVLHCFRKKSQRTNRLDVETARRRYKELMRERGQ